MTIDEQIAEVRRLLDFTQKFRQGIADLTEGPAKPTLLASADATVAKVQAALATLEALAATGPETLQ